MTLILQGTDNSVSSPAVQGGTAGATTGVYYPATNQVALATNGALALLVDASQNVLVGTTSLYGGEKLAMLQSTNNRGFVIQQTNASNTSPPFLIDASRNTTNNTYNAIAYFNSGAGAYKFQVADSGSIATAGSVGLGTATPPNNGIGIAFPATQSASSDANTLDDYEEGTFTPDFFNNGASSTWSVKQGLYRKVGSLVTCWMNCSGTGNSGGGGGAIIFNLPFAMASGQPGFFGLAATIGGTGSPYEQLNSAGGTGTQGQMLYNVAGNQEQGTLTTVRACISYVTN